MNRVVNKNIISELGNKEVICVFSNFEQLLNGADDSKTGAYLTPFKLTMFAPEAYLGDERAIYDLGGGYFMFRDKQEFHKNVNAILAKQGIENLLNDFEYTTSIYKVVD